MDAVLGWQAHHAVLCCTWSCWPWPAGGVAALAWLVAGVLRWARHAGLRLYILVGYCRRLEVSDPKMRWLGEACNMGRCALVVASAPAWRLDGSVAVRLIWPVALRGVVPTLEEGLAGGPAMLPVSVVVS